MSDRLSQAAIAARVSWLQSARADQLPPEYLPEWLYFLTLAGRGAGKTKLSTEDCAWYAMTHPQERIAVVCPTYNDVRAVYFEGPSGLLKALPPGSYKYNKSTFEIELFNGAIIRGFSAEEPDRLRGPQHHRAYADELAAWRYADTWDQLLFGLRLGKNPRVVITTTPRPTPLVRSILSNPRTIVVRGSTFDNAANLAAGALDELKKKFDGTRLGRQELYGEVLDDVPGALWTRAMIDQARAPIIVPDFERVVVAVDPSGVRNEADTGSDEVGIVAAAKGVDGRGYVLADWSCRMSPLGWGRRAVDAYNAFSADRIVAERNFGGAMVEHVIKSVDANVPFREVVASRGKIQRAEPIAALYEQGRISHVVKGPLGGFAASLTGLDPFLTLEDQMCQMTRTGFLGDGSPDRVDGVVWALSELFLGDSADGFLGHYKATAAAAEEKRKEAEEASGWIPKKKA